MRRFDLERSDIVILLLAALYILSPVDVIPEIVAGPVGLTDDLAALALIGTKLVRARRRAVSTGPGSEPLASS